ncbi:MAG: hypothetical protein K6G75_03235 [Lachnospiraceae bacterium]|nr:hypothetical protein [Lachnospiraceae bacterium]
MKEEMNWSIGGDVSKEKDASGISAGGVNHVVYEKYKGKQAYGHKEWTPSKGEKVAVISVMIVALIVIIATFATYFLPLPLGFKIPVMILGGILFIVIVGGFVLIVTLRHNKQDPVEMKYYDVDYEMNHITGEGYDNTREISKEEFEKKKS